jgi:L-lactate dehydrogenase (cytochrome)
VILLTPNSILLTQWNQSSFETFLGPDFPKGQLPDLKDVRSTHDFEYAAGNFLNDTAYAWIRYRTGGEWTYRHNLEIFPRVGFKQRVLRGNTNVNMSMEQATYLHGELEIFIH